MTRGRVVAVAPMVMAAEYETPSRSIAAPAPFRDWPSYSRRSHSAIGPASAAMPIIAAKLSWKDTLQRTLGLIATITAAASPNAGRTLRGRPRKSAAR